MKIGVIILGVIASLMLFVGGCTGAFIFEVGGEVFDGDTSALVVAGAVAILSSPFVLLGGVLPYALRKTCFVLLILGTILAWSAFLIDLQSAFALVYLFGALITTIATVLAGLALRENRIFDMRTGE